MKREQDSRQESTRRRKIKSAGFPYIKTMDELDYNRFEHMDGLYKINATNVANYAVEKLQLHDLRYYHFNRNEEVKQYIVELNEQLLDKQENAATLADTSYSTMDIPSLINLSKDNLITSLENIDIYIKNLAKSNTKLIVENKKLRKELDVYSVDDLSTRKNHTENEKRLSGNLEELKNDIKDLKKEKTKTEKDNKNLKNAIHILWDMEAAKVLQTLGIVTIENEEELINGENNLIIEDVDENINALDISIEELKQDEDEHKIIEHDFRNSIKDL